MLNSLNVSFSGSQSQQSIGSITTNDSKNTYQERILPIHKLSPVELHKQKEQGLCYNYDERYTVEHKLKKLFFIKVEEEIREVANEGSRGGEDD